MALIQALQHVHTHDLESIFVVKGGTAIELRLRNDARMTRDVDATFHGSRDQLQHVLEQAFANPVGGFAVIAMEPEPIGRTGALRITCKITYRTRPWGTLVLELSIEDRPPEFELVPAFDLTTLGLHGPERRIRSSGVGAVSTTGASTRRS